MCRRRVLALVAGVLAVLALALTAAFAGGAAAGTTATTYTDPAGDSKGAPDITSVAVTDVPSLGAAMLSVTATGFANADPATYPTILAYLDTDKNPATGFDGSEYLLAAADGPEGGGWDLDRWNGSTWDSVPQSRTMAYAESGDTVSWTFGKDDLGGATGFAFFVVGATFDGDFNLTASDVAPDGGVWAFAMTPAAALEAVVGAPAVKPAVATAGRPFSLTFPVTRSDNGQPLASGTMICDPSVNGKVIPHVELFAGGKAQLSFVIPKSAKGKLLKVRMTIKVGGVSTTRVVAFRVR